MKRDIFMKKVKKKQKYFFLLASVRIFVIWKGSG